MERINLLADELRGFESGASAETREMILNDMAWQDGSLHSADRCQMYHRAAKVLRPWTSRPNRSVEGLKDEGAGLVALDEALKPCR